MYKEVGVEMYQGTSIPDPASARLEETVRSVLMQLAGGTAHELRRWGSQALQDGRAQDVAGVLLADGKLDGPLADRVRLALAAVG